MSTIFVDNVKTVSGTDTFTDGQYRGVINASATGTFAGTTTGTHSGTATGTHSGTTTGTISSSATFPSGHIIQTQTAQSTLSNSVSTDQLANSGTVGLDVASVDITPRGTGSKFLIQCRVCFNFSRTTNYQCASEYIGRGVGSGGMSGSDLSTIYHFSLLAYLGSQAGDDVYMDHPLFFVDDTVSYSSGQTITYNFRLGSGRGSGSVGYPTLYYRNDGGNYFPAQMIVTEIAG